ITRGGDPRRSGERLDADPRVVRKRGKLRARARVTGLGERVFYKRRMRLIGIGDPQLSLRHDLDAERREQPTELAQLAGIGGCEDQTIDHFRASAFFCAAISSLMPSSARAISASICIRENGALSAVPCISTK